MEITTDELLHAKNKVMKDIFGELAVSENVEEILKKWRTIFKIPQKSLAAELNITSSVISDYESGRRKSPGINMLKKYMGGLISIDLKTGGSVIRSFGSLKQERHTIPESILDIKELLVGISPDKFCAQINAEIIVPGVKKDIYGYTIIDSLKAITESPASELVNIYGSTTQRALIFTKVSTGRSPMIAIKLTGLKPALVVLHGLGNVDDIAKRIAEAEGIPLAVCRMEKAESIIEKLREMK